MTEARETTVTVRVTKAQKKRIRKQAKKNGESVSALLLRAAEQAGALPPRAEPKAEGERFVFRFREEGEPVQSSRPEAQRGAGEHIALDSVLVSCGE